MGHRLLLGKRAAERLPGRHVVEGCVERGLCHPDGEGADAGAEQVEGPHRHPEPGIDLAERVGGLHAHPVEDQAADGVRGQELEVLAR